MRLTKQAKSHCMNQIIQVLQVIDALNIGGAQRAVLNWISGLRETRFRISLAVLHGPGTMDAAFNAAGCVPHYLASSKWDPRIVWRLRAMIRKGNFDIVHAHLVPSSFLCERFRTFLGIRRCVIHAHTFYQRNDQQYQNVLERGMYRHADLLLGCSKAVLDSIPSNLPKRVAYNGVDFNQFAVVPQNAIREKLGFQPNDFVVGTVGRLAPAKDPETLCRAVALLDDIPEIRLLFVGSGPLHNRLEQLAAELHITDRVIFAGAQQDVTPFLHAMNMFVLPSRTEGFGLSLIEAMACGRPCIAANSPAITEIFSPGKEGLIFQPGDAQNLAAQIRTFYQNPKLRQRCATAGRDHAHAVFSLDAAAHSLIESYEYLLQQTP